ncbi:Capsule polysaccharide biosynthesis protein [Mannheimia haemolytica]|uniref:Capsule polysaccharide biosynthesis protein n=1 Tax=Mannheimia haemolytica TaxID=75985 RepID=A0A448T6A3_MANHA|nr:capsular polysaccharide biosynthesis protein [Mannheimia haemolytica]UQX67675.1 capsular polysaccharide biosynthesis protein [Mannheimia haemolytica]STY62059.1 Capsule polysaccharide biosynthesis protein [Mannheimia haemolytica]VEI75516.1 Capsule polysaccharide biosynthesis protein [Mannheimia haemolytica]
MYHSFIFSQGIFKIPFLQSFLPESILIQKSYFTVKFISKTKVDQIIGWGLRPSTVKARDYAKKHHIPYVALEDGFLRSLGLGVKGYPPFSLVYDDIGIYYDTTRPSRLEKFLLEQPLQDQEQIKLAEKALYQILTYQLSKYNHALDFSEIPSAKEKIVLVIDQTFGDMAVKYGQASEVDFNKMLEAAIRENPGAQIWVKTHPDVLSGKKKGYLTDLSQYAERVRIITEDVNPASLIKWCEKVYCVTSQMGFEALLLGKKVITFGVPWFAGWGVTDDRNEAVQLLVQQNRRKDRSLLQLFYAAYFDYSRYINPNTGEKGSIFDVIDYLYKAKRLNQRLSGNLYCIGMSLWKQAVIKPFFNLPQCRLHFVRSLNSLKKRPLADNAKILVWSNGKADVLQFAQQNNIPLLRMEDGFIRSVGLGANLVAPLSLVVDDLGIYFNAENTSRLEQILLSAEHFSETDLSYAETLRQKLVVSHIGKYNVGGGDVKFNAQGKKIILVPGQVEDDASIKSGSPQIKKNADLLRKVRELNPDAYIIYKPHPDVVSGNRVGQIVTKETLQFADQIIDNANILDCILKVDEVHTMTSLAGFEALLRGKKVYCYGLPFYAGWGLTEDLLKLERRGKSLTLPQLIAATLIYYPLYVDPIQGRFIDANQAINLLEKQKNNLVNQEIKRSWVSKQYGKLQHLYRAFKYTSNTK